MKGATRLVLLLGMALVCAQAQSQTMYKCGKVYQDRPCDAGKAGKAIGSTGTAAAPARSVGVDAECAQRGRDSLKIVWSREGGATEERLVSEASAPAQKRFVRDVYRRPGAASTVQAAVEADCIAEKQKLEQEAALAAAAAVRAQREGAPPASPATQPAAQPDPAAEARRRAEREASEAEGKKRLCAQYNAEVNDLRSRERAGGSLQAMERLNESRRQLRERMSASGC
jgi:hypothetical protein